MVEMFKNTMRKYCKEGSKINQIFMAVLVVMPALAYGQAIGWMSPMSLLLRSTDTPAQSPLHDDTISWMASVTYIVGTPAVFLFGHVADHYGRKRALLLTSFSMAMCWTLKLCSTEPWALITARGITGLVVAGSYVVTPLYMKEIAEDSIRGALGSLVILSQNLGNVMVYVMGDLMSYYAVLWACLAVPLLHLALFACMPETPSYLVKCGQVEEAKSVLAWLRCRPAADRRVAEELARLTLEAEQDRANAAAYRTLFTDAPTFRAFRITLMVNLAREVCGCIAVLMFASEIFLRAGGGAAGALSPNRQAAVLGTVQLIGSCFASSLVERAGRKPLLAVTCAVSGLSMALLGTWFWLQERSATSALPAWLPTAALCVCIFCDAGGLQPVPFVIMTEIFSFQLRGTVTSLVIAFACALDSAQLRVFQPVANAVGMSVVFWMFSGVCLLSTLYIVLYVPETKMRSLEDIYAELSRRGSSGGGGGKKKEHSEAGDTHITRL